MQGSETDVLQMTDRQTEHGKKKSVAIGGITCAARVTQPQIQKHQRTNY